MNNFTATSPSVFEQMSALEHEQVVYCYDKKSGLRCIIAIHSTLLGPALGGTRMWSYSSESEALTDVLRLSRGMTYKASITGLALGGGKAVIIGNSKTDKTSALWLQYGKCIEGLNGRYITAEDVGTTTDDMEIVSQKTSFVTGRSQKLGGSGDPSIFTAYGTYLGIKASSKKFWNSDNLSGKTILVQGIGQVGMYVVEHLHKENAKILVSDIQKDRLLMASQRFGATIIPIEDVYKTKMDIYCPCALGSTINDETLSQLQCSIIAGASNNQLQDEQKHSVALKEKGILYAPDFVINAGGLISVYSELHPEINVKNKTELIYDRLISLFSIAETNNITTYEAALTMAKIRLDSVLLPKAST